MVGDRAFKKLPIQLGTVDARNARELVVGRTELVERLWDTIRGGNMRLLSERRMGKTWVLWLAVALKPGWALPLVFDAEGAQSAPEFVWRLNRALHRSGHVPDVWLKKVTDWFRRVCQRIQDGKLGTWEIPKLDPWVSLLEDTCRHFVKRSGEQHGVLMFDELPYFLDKLIRGGRGQEAIEVLDGLRSLRHELPTLRMIFCGSLGLHIVLGKLHEVGYSGQPVNDMPPFDLPPLDGEEAYYLAGCLLLGVQVPCSDTGAVARAMAEASSGVPFYIQHIASWMNAHREREWTAESARSVPEALFNATGDPAQFTYYNRRLDDYYPEDVVEKARAALDVLSREPQGMAFDRLRNLVRHRPKTLTVDPEQLLEVMETLRHDHYVVRDDDHWRFKLEIVRAWWHNARGRHAL